MGVFERFFFFTLISLWGIKIRRLVPMRGPVLANSQAGAPACHPAASKFTTLESFQFSIIPFIKNLAQNMPFFRPKGPMIIKPKISQNGRNKGGGGALINSSGDF